MPNKCSEKNDFGDFHIGANDLNSWEFYVKKDTMITWRREEEDGHYAYKGLLIFGTVDVGFKIFSSFSLCELSRHHSR